MSRFDAVRGFRKQKTPRRCFDVDSFIATAEDIAEFLEKVE